MLNKNPFSFMACKTLITVKNRNLVMYIQYLLMHIRKSCDVYFKSTTMYILNLVMYNSESFHICWKNLEWNVKPQTTVFCILLIRIFYNLLSILCNMWCMFNSLFCIFLKLVMHKSIYLRVIKYFVIYTMNVVMQIL